MASELLVLNEVRQVLLEEARSSPALLSDLAGLEGYVAESYDSRSFIELLQNADDAGAQRVWIQRREGCLIIANDGREFDKSDFEGLCRSASSHKARGSSIGYRGIGFKSVVNLAQTVHLVSGSLATTFSRAKTEQEIPSATGVPLIRIPHPMGQAEQARFRELAESLGDGGYVTAFIFEALIAEKIEEEFEKFDPSSLLFLRNLNEISLLSPVERSYKLVRKRGQENSQTIKFFGPDYSKDWHVVQRQDFCIAFSSENGEICRLDKMDAVAHSFLPTHAATGFPFKVQGDFSTDPSRTRVVFDERTSNGIGQLSKLYSGLLRTALENEPKMLAALIPYSDPRMSGFQKQSFSTALLKAIQETVSEEFAMLRLKPKWLNILDYEQMISQTDVWFLGRVNDGVDGLSELVRFFGARESSFEELEPLLVRTKLSVAGAAEVVAHLCQKIVTKQMGPSNFNHDWLIWQGSNNLLTSFGEAREAVLNPQFVALVVEKFGVVNDLRRFLEAVSDKETATSMLAHIDSEKPTPSENKAAFPKLAGAINETLGLKKWRKTEQQVLDILIAKGWQMEDVSRQNVGYDLEGRNLEGDNVFVEVKSIDYLGQPFALTANEVAVAQDKKQSYILAVAKPTDRYLDVTLIYNPIENLTLNRQCRQWTWECSEYGFNGERYTFD